MFQEIYKWLQDIVFYLVIVTAVLEVLPGTNYQKYIRFFAGLILILLLFTPFLKLSGARPLFHELYKNAKNSAAAQEEEFSDIITESGELLEFFREPGVQEKNDGGGQAEKENQIKVEVEEVHIGEKME